MPDPIVPPSPPAPTPGPKPPPADDPDYLARLRQENGYFRQRYQEQVAETNRLQTETGRLQEQLGTMSDYAAIQGKATALEQQIRGDRLTARLSREMIALGVTSVAKQALCIKATDLKVTFDGENKPQGDFSPLAKTVETLGLAPTSTTDSDDVPPGEGGTQAKPNEGDGTQTPPPPKVAGATHNAPDPNRPMSYEDIVAEGLNILDRSRSAGA